MLFMVYWEEKPTANYIFFIVLGFLLHHAPYGYQGVHIHHFLYYSLANAKMISVKDSNKSVMHMKLQIGCFKTERYEMDIR